MKKISIVFLCLLFISSLSAQSIEKVRPLNWWIGMKNPKLQIMVYGKNIGKSQVSLDYQGVTLESAVQVENPNYLFVNLHISPEAKAGKMPLKFTMFAKKKSQTLTYEYELLERKSQTNRILGFDSSDLIYLVMPDRFANGNPDNDNTEDTSEKANRQDKNGRHGGDLQGVIDHIAYFKSTGITTLWLNPVLENDRPHHSYHGYAATDLYTVDSRFGGNEKYLELIEKLHENGLKIIMDMVNNHISELHWTITDKPMKNWVNHPEKYVQTNYRAAVVGDPYAAKKDTDVMVNGWFVKEMADLNQKNPFVANYLIQNNIWWIEYAGIDGIRMDTYVYPDKDFSNDWVRAIMSEYPQFNIVGEVWATVIGNEAYWQNRANRDGYTSVLPSVTDFPFYYAVRDALRKDEQFGWSSGLARMYYMLSQDHLYTDPNNNVTFLDNHDDGRFYNLVSKRYSAYELGITFLLTTRGIPQIYYGTEILFDGNGYDGHGFIREDFLGGWEGDTENAFTGKLADEPKKAQAFFQKLANWRKTATAVTSGKLTHFVPENNVYVYFRYTENQMVMVILHDGDQAQTLKTERFDEFLKKYTSATNILTDEMLSDLSEIKLKPHSSMVLELK